MKLAPSYLTQTIITRVARRSLTGVSAMDGERHISAVDNGVVNFFSVSALEKADTRNAGCMRAYYYRYVLRIKQPETLSTAAGGALHAELADHLRTGSRHLSALALSGLFMVPDPGPDLLVEADIDNVITAAGVPLIGQLDCAHSRGTNKGGNDITEIYDPPNTVEIIDWKWKGDGAKTEFQLQPNELAHSIQMSGYAIYAHKIFPQAQNVRMSHGLFFATRGRPRKVTKLQTFDQPLRTWEYVESLGRSIQHAVRETNVDKVDANIHGCGKFGGCFYRDRCSAYKKAFADQSTATLFGETLSKEISMGLQMNPPAGGSFLSMLPQQQPVAQIDLQAQLKLEEERMRAQAAQVQSGVTLDFASAWRIIEGCGRGYPALTGRAASQRAALVGQQVPSGSTLTGAGDLQSITLEDPAHVISLGQELSPQPAPVVHVQHNTLAMQPTNPNPVLPPDAPQSNPALAAQPMPGYPQPGVLTHPGPAPMPGQATTTLTMQPQPQQWASLPVTGTVTSHMGAALAGMPVGTIVQGVQPQNLSQAAAAVPPKRRGRPPRKPVDAAAVQQVANAQAQGDGDLEVYVDCIVNDDTTTINAYVEGMLDILCDKFVPKEGLHDIRVAPSTSPLGYGGWKGALRAMVIEFPPPPDTYVIHTHNDEIMAIVADAMLVVCNKHNARYVRGIR